jgi:hypothetical protein
MWYLLIEIVGYELGSQDFITGSSQNFSLRHHVPWPTLGFLSNADWGLFPGGTVEIKNLWSYTSCTRLFLFSITTVVVVVVVVVVLLLTLKVEKDTSFER